MRLLDLFDVDISGRDFARGKPDPEIFLTAGAELALPPHQCFVVEDAVAGIEAARAGGMAALGVARADDVELLSAAQADLVVTSLDDADLGQLAEGGAGGALSLSLGRSRAALGRSGALWPALRGNVRPVDSQTRGRSGRPLGRAGRIAWSYEFSFPVRVVFEVPQEVLYRADHGHHLLPVEPFT